MNENTDKPKFSIDRILRLPLQNYMPAEGREFRYAADVGIPNQGASAIVVQFKVPQGFNGFINRLKAVYVGGGFEEGQGLIIWTLYQDFQQSTVMPGFNNITAAIGGPNGPEVMNGLKVKQNQLVTLQVSNSNPGVVPAGQLIGGIIGGYFYPVSIEPKLTF